MGLDKTAQGYQEEGIIKLLKDIRDGLRRGVIRPNNRPNNDNGHDDNGDDDNGYDDDNHDNDDDMPDLETEEETAERIAKKETKTSDDDDDKVFDVLNKFNDKMENDMRNLDKMVTDKENERSTKLNELNNDFKKLDNYIKEHNDKKINTEKKNR